MHQGGADDESELVASDLASANLTSAVRVYQQKQARVHELEQRILFRGSLLPAASSPFHGQHDMRCQREIAELELCILLTRLAIREVECAATKPLAGTGQGSSTNCYFKTLLQCHV